MEVPEWAVVVVQAVVEVAVEVVGRGSDGGIDLTV